MDAEQVGSTFTMYNLDFGDFKQDSLNYEKKTATYSIPCTVSVSHKFTTLFDHTLIAGYKKAYRDDWNDLPTKDDWPKVSVSSAKDKNYKKNGALIAVEKNTI